MIRPLSSDLNRIIHALVPCHLAADNAPETFAQLQACTTPRAPIRVWAGGSSGTIYGDAETNWAFRAWHDTYHLAHGLPFTFEGESLVCELQIAHMLEQFPRAPGLWANLLRAEIIGQLEFTRVHGRFPIAQQNFVQAYLVDRAAAILQPY